MSTHHTIGHNRKHIRLRGWDYRSPGWYFVTICLQDVRCVLATPADGRLQDTTDTDTTDTDAIAGPAPHATNNASDDVGHAKPFSQRHSDISPTAGSLSVVIRTWKGAVKTWAQGNGFPQFDWQYRFHDHIIRSAAGLWRIRRYIRQNPARWLEDRHGNVQLEVKGFGDNQVSPDAS